MWINCSLFVIALYGNVGNIQEINLHGYKLFLIYRYNMDGFVQERYNPIANALELRLSGTN